jgi:hypothetical protein
MRCFILPSTLQLHCYYYMQTTDTALICDPCKTEIPDRIFTSARGAWLRQKSCQDFWGSSRSRGSRGAGVHEALSDGGSAGRDGLTRCWSVFIYIGVFFRAVKEKDNVCSCGFVYEHKEKARLHAQTLGPKTPALGSAILLVGE